MSVHGTKRDREMHRVTRQMNGADRRFSPMHPFWNAAIKLRQQGESIATVTEQARAAGWDLTSQMVALGLRGAPANLGLPSRAAVYLRERYREITDDFSAIEVQKHMILETIREREDVEQQIANPELTLRERKALGDRYDVLTQRAFHWSSQAAELQAKLEGAQLAAGAQVAAAREAARSPMQFLDSLASEFHKRIPPPADPTELVERFGADNIRFPSADYIQGEARYAEDD